MYEPEPKCLSLNEFNKAINKKPIKFAEATEASMYQCNAPEVLFLMNRNIGNDSSAMVSTGNRNMKNIINSIAFPVAPNTRITGKNT